MRDYLEALQLPAGGDPGAAVLRVLEQLDAHTLRLTVRPFGDERARGGPFYLRVPEVTPVPFKGDAGLHGHVLRNTNGTEWFCPPRYRSEYLEELQERFSPEKSDELLAELRGTTDLRCFFNNWYDRLHDAVRLAVQTLLVDCAKPGGRRLTPRVLQHRLQRVVDHLILGEPGGEGGLGLLDPERVNLLHDMFELEVAYPTRIGDEVLREEAKLRLLAAVDGCTSILHTGKGQSVGRRVMRVRGDEPLSHVTGTRVPRFALAANPLATHAGPLRVFRENRALRSALPFAEPVAPPLRARGIKVPEPFQRRITTLWIAICDLPGWNVFPAGDTASEWGVSPEQETCPDVLLVTASGRRKLRAYQTQGDLESEEAFAKRLDERRELPGFRFREQITPAAELANGSSLFKYDYRWWADQPIACGVDKVKILCGGIKAVTSPRTLPDLWTEIRGQRQEVDLIVAEQTVLSKGARDLVLYLGAALAGFQELDPSEPTGALTARVQATLPFQGIAPDGRLPLFTEGEVLRSGRQLLTKAEGAQMEALGAVVTRERGPQELGRCLIGPAPVMRAIETEHRAASARAGVPVSAFQGRPFMGLPLQVPGRTEQQLAELATFHRVCSR